MHRLSFVSRPRCDVLTRVRVINRMGAAHGRLWSPSSPTSGTSVRRSRTRGYVGTPSSTLSGWNRGGRTSHGDFSRELHTETPSADGNREGPRLRDHWPGLGSPGSIGRRRHACNHLAGVRRCDQGPTGRPTDCFERACGVGAQSLRVPTRHGLRNSIPLERPEPPPASIWERRPARGVVRH